MRDRGGVAQADLADLRGWLETRLAGVDKAVNVFESDEHWPRSPLPRSTLGHAASLTGMDPKLVKFIKHRRQRPSWRQVAAQANKAGYRTVTGRKWEGGNLRQWALQNFPDEPWSHP